MEYRQKKLSKYYLIIINSIVIFLVSCSTSGPPPKSDNFYYAQAPQFNASVEIDKITGFYERGNWPGIYNRAVQYPQEESIIWAIFKQEPVLFSIILEAIIINNDQTCFQTYRRIVPINRVKEIEFDIGKTIVFFYNESINNWNKLVGICRKANKLP